MPLFGIVRDSPWIYAGQRVARAVRPRRIARGNVPSFAPSNISSGYKFSKLRIYDGALYAFLHTERGDLWWFMQKRAAVMISNSKLQVGVKTGNLRKSIKVIYHRGTVTGQEMKIGSATSYAFLHHEGSRPHQIRPRQGNKLIRFQGRSGMVFTDVVNHPGTQPNRFLSDQLYHFRY